jgi:hypothetical protein
MLDQTRFLIIFLTVCGLALALADNYEEEEDMELTKKTRDSSEMHTQQQAPVVHHYIDHDYSIFYTKNINLTSVLNKQIRLPCMVENGRKFIWMKADRNEILTIDNMLITGDRRFSIEHSAECYDKVAKSDSSGSNTKKTNKKVHGSNIQSRHVTHDENSGISVENVGCWVYLCIENVNMNDEGLYVCQIDTMSSTRISVNILGECPLQRRIFL